ncbi:hypothetical protein CENDO_10255 [Corynebacterium endometrii]|uniref:Uncharacterized protein n=1 Tax=Corynebacterium endometrii TaxID=2488819 RepID=A0A4P7QI30_9CORY|nr:hypothetical protein CENDO_10255 [Corynebacterium endometrii]
MKRINSNLVVEFRCEKADVAFNNSLVSRSSWLSRRNLAFSAITSSSTRVITHPGGPVEPTGGRCATTHLASGQRPDPRPASKGSPPGCDPLPNERRDPRILTNFPRHVPDFLIYSNGTKPGALQTVGYRYTTLTDTARPIGGNSEELYESALTSNFYCLSNHPVISLFVRAIEICWT